HRGAELADAQGTFRVSRFVEKPDRGTAERLLTDGDYFWNSGMFLFSPLAWLEALSAYAPQVLESAGQALRHAKRDLDFLRLDRDIFTRTRSISIDYAVMEHTQNAVIVPANIGWSDIGSWSMLWARGEKDTAGNCVSGDVLLQDARNNYVRSEERLIAALGVEDLIIIDTRDAVLIAQRDRDQDVKLLVEQLLRSNRPEAFQHSRVHRPWGMFQTLHMSARTQVKLIEVNPGAALSLQYHHRRAEHWVVVSGEACITRGEDELVLRENESTYIPIGMKHRLENRLDQPLRLIEVQVGE